MLGWALDEFTDGRGAIKVGNGIVCSTQVELINYYGSDKP